MSRPLRLVIIAGEVSGDMHAARLVEAIRRKAPDSHFYGIGGDELRKAGMTVWHDAREMAVMGLTEVIARYPFFRRIFFDLLDRTRTLRPDAVIPVDYPGFNLRFSARAHALGFKVLYFICPQVWAWHRSRIPKMAQVVDRLIAIFPFEPEVFRGTGLRVDFVGHPLVDEVQRVLSEPVAPLPWRGEPRIALLPGSRRHEVERLLPGLWRAAALIERARPAASFILPAPSDGVAAIIRERMAGLGPGPSRWEIVVGQTRQVLRQARAALVASGTATLESALLRCPTVVVYRTSWLTYLLGRMLVRVNHIGIVNVIARRGVCPEFIQNGFTPEAVAAALVPLLDDGPSRGAMLAGFDEVARSLGPPGAMDRAADAILAELSRP